MRLILCLVLLAGLSACNNKKQEDKAKQDVKNAAVPEPKYFFNPAHGQPGHTCALAVGAPLPASGQPQPSTVPSGQQTVVTPPPVTPAVVVDPKDTRPNPKHGEPGHRCDIAVGQPLNTPSGTPAAATQNKTVTPSVTNQVVVNPKDTRPNPAHGQPGHRCDIPVGQPLNTPAPKPANNTVTTSKTVTPAFDPKDTRPNPAHGQPGHRCDIAVGLPLNTKPGQQAKTDTAAKH